MKFGSLFSGVGGFDLGLERAGMECVWQCEIDPKRREILAKHWPEIRRYEDVRSVSSGRPQSCRDGGAVSHTVSGTAARLHSVDLICGGFPCQDLSVAGQRAGLAGSRSGLWWEFDRIIGEVRPAWVLLENVPGLLSSNGGDDFALILDALGKRGYGYAYRILDSRYFGVPQRRRRVFVVGHSSGRCDYPASVLFEPEGGGGHTPASGTKGEGVAGTLGGGPSGARGYRNDLDNDTYVTAGPPEVSGTVSSKWRKGSGGPAGDEAYNLVPPEAVVWHENQGGNLAAGGVATRALKAGASHSYQGVGVRRLTPVECARLQSFPDDWASEWSDSVQYAAYGDAVTVPVIQWIGERMEKVPA